MLPPSVLMQARVSALGSPSVPSRPVYGIDTVHSLCVRAERHNLIPHIYLSLISHILSCLGAHIYASTAEPALRSDRQCLNNRLTAACLV